MSQSGAAFSASSACSLGYWSGGRHECDRGLVLRACSVLRASQLNQGAPAKLIDRIRQDIHDRLEQLLAEAEKLRRALAALDPREKAPPKPTPKRAPKPVRRSASPTTSTRAPRSAAPRRPVLAEPKSSSPARTASGAAKAKVLGALFTDRAMTAGEVANADFRAARSALLFRVFEVEAAAAPPGNGCVGEVGAAQDG